MSKDAAEKGLADLNTAVTRHTQCQTRRTSNKWNSHRPLYRGVLLLKQEFLRQFEFLTYAHFSFEYFILFCMMFR